MEITCAKLFPRGQEGALVKVKMSDSGREDPPEYWFHAAPLHHAGPFLSWQLSRGRGRGDWKKWGSREPTSHTPACAFQQDPAG
jgi:hypothetical protein